MTNLTVGATLRKRQRSTFIMKNQPSKLLSNVGKERNFLPDSMIGLLEDEMECDIRFFLFSIQFFFKERKRALDFKLGCTSKRFWSVQRSVNAAKGQVRPSKMPMSSL